METSSVKPRHLVSWVLSSSILVLSGCTGGDGDDGGDRPAPNDGTDTEGNSAPNAYDISLRSDGTTPILDIQLIGDDPDDDTVVYVLDSPRSGAGYSLAFVEPDTGMAHVVLDGTLSGDLELSYRVSDGVLFSESAGMTVEIASLNDGANGANDVSPEEYNAVDVAYFGDGLYEDGDEDNTLPSSMDLSNNFPPPGDQGAIGSCVGWAVGYALKSYQEKVEEQWDYSSASTLFSPSWIYNQINGGVDGGSSPIHALQLIVDSGAATMATMPYDTDYTSQPSSAAREEAAAYKAESFSRISGTDNIKRSLVARTPVTIGINTYNSLSGLSGSDSVFNDFSGPQQGGHAVTIVGYDDARFGGAFKIINSWGADWGDGGYFWLPYDKVTDIVLIALILNDATNTGVQPIPPQPPVDDSLPNLIVTRWSASYNPIAGGEGILEWEVSNIGSTTALAGADLNLVLSKDEIMDVNDILVRYEELPYDLPAGESLYRDETNPLAFSFPLDLPAGEYYIGIWLDDLNEVDESDETDNISFGTSPISITEAQLPDLVVDSWWASWNDLTGAGELEFKVSNVGNASLNSTEWDINLVLSTGEDVVNTFAYYLHYEPGDYALQAGEYVFRDASNRASFSMFESMQGNTVIPGEYFISLWVDDLDVIEESREYNNLSTDNIVIDTSSVAKSAASDALSHRFNGKAIPEDWKMQQAKISIVADADGELQVRSLERRAKSEDEAPVFEKQVNARDSQIYPVVEKTAMPATVSTEESSQKLMSR